MSNLSHEPASIATKQDIGSRMGGFCGDAAGLFPAFLDRFFDQGRHYHLLPVRCKIRLGQNQSGRDADFLCPEGTFDNSPAVHCWGMWRLYCESRRDDREAGGLRRFGRPYGTRWSDTGIPSDESLGYYQMSLRDKPEIDCFLMSAGHVGFSCCVVKEIIQG